MPRSSLPPALLLGLLIALLSPGCFSTNFAEGYYVESEESGRWLAHERNAEPVSMRFFRLNLVQFDEEATGVVELFDLDSHGDLEDQPLVFNQSQPNYFCARIDSASTRNDNLVARFTDDLNRRWEFSTAFADERLSGELLRVDASGNALPNPLPNEAQSEGSPYLLPEDRRYFEDAVTRAEQAQLILERQRSEIDRSFLSCPDYEEQYTLELELPIDQLRDRLGDAHDRSARLALVMTRPQRGLTNDAIERLNAEETLTATIEAVDLLDNGRTLMLRLPPPESFLQSGVAVGMFVVYEDLPESETSPQNNRWDSLQSGSIQLERVLAYSARVVVFNAGDAPPAHAPRDAQGESLGSCPADNPVGGRCLFESASAHGWSLHDYGAETLVLPSNERVSLIRRLRGLPLQTTELLMVGDACMLCYPSPTEGCDPEICDPILPLLYL